MMSAYQAFGVSPFSARLFSVLAGVLLVAVVYFFVRKIVHEQAAFWSSITLIASLQMAIQFHLAVPDPYLILFFTTGLLCFYVGVSMQQKKYIYLFYVCAALAFLSKGLIAVVFPGLIVLIFWLFNGGITWARLKEIHLLPGALLFLLIAAPWYIAVGIKTQGVWLEGFFLQHNLQRYAYTMEGHGGFFGLPFLIIIGATLPLSLFFVQAVKGAWQNRKQQPFLFFCLIVVGVVALFFTFSKTILPSYPAPAVPFFAMVLGVWLTNRLKVSQTKRADFLVLTIHLIIAISIPVTAHIALQQEATLAALAPLSFLLLILPLSAILSILFWNKARQLACGFLIGGWIGVSLIFFWILNPALDKQTPIYASAGVLDEATTVYYKAMNPAFVFARRGTIASATVDEIEMLLRTKERLIVITRQPYQSDLDHLPLDVLYCKKDLFENRVSCVLKSR
jgi:4-amino-4-deoxy-L-arabinose transferase-like glycosyltransferase